MASIELKQIHKWFDNLQVINGVDLSIKKGEFVVFVGPSGCGKSTLLRIIAGLEDATSGSVLIDSEDVTGNLPSERSLAMVFQSYALYPHMNVQENIGFALKTAGVDKKIIEKKVVETANILELNALLKRLPKQLSGGQRQRVAIGRAIIREPKGFLFDEPLSNLDAALRVNMRLEISRLHKKLGITTIYVTHDQIEAMTLADRIVVLNKGEVVQEGTPQKLYNQPNSLFVAEFIGSPKMNVIPCYSQEGNIILQLEKKSKTKIKSPQQKIAKIGVRAESISVTELNKADLSGELVLCEYLGSEQFAYVDCGNDILITVRIEPKVKLIIGSRIGLIFNPDSVHFFSESGQRIEQKYNSLNN